MTGNGGQGNISFKDKRSRLLALTKDGLHLLSRAFPIWQETQQQLENQVTDTAPKRLLAALINLSRESGT